MVTNDEESFCTTKQFTETLFCKIRSDSRVRELSPVCTVLWISKFLTFVSATKRLNQVDRQRVLKFAAKQSRSDVGFLARYSFSSIVGGADAQLNTDSPDLKRFIFRTLFSTLHIISFVYISTVILFNRGCSILYSTKRISSHTLEMISGFHFKDEYLRGKFLAVPELKYVPKISMQSEFDHGSPSKIIQVLIELILESVENSTDQTFISDTDVRIHPGLINDVIIFLAEFFPEAQFSKQSFIKRLLVLTPRLLESTRRVIVVDDCFQVLRNPTMFEICKLFDVEAVGVQHGGQYGELISLQTAIEINNGAYVRGFYLWNFDGRRRISGAENLGKHNSLGFYGEPGVLYPSSVIPTVLESISPESNVIQLILNSRAELLSGLKEISVPVWHRSHPKDGTKDYISIDNRLLKKGQHKPGIDPDSVRLVIFDAPGQTLMYECLCRDIKFICYFDPRAYSLTDSANRFYSNLAKASQFVDASCYNSHVILKNALNKFLRN